MASRLYPKGAEHLLSDIDLLADNIKILFYSGVYNGAHVFVADLVGASIIARSGNLAGKTVTDGNFDANDITVVGVSGAAFTHVIAFKDTGSDATSRLIPIWDVPSFSPSGSDIHVIWNALGLFSIA